MPPVGWAKELDRGIDDFDQGCVIPVSQLVSDLDAALAEITDEADGELGSEIVNLDRSQFT